MIMAVKKNVILVHGFLESESMWSELLQNTSSRLAFHTIALPGHKGGSEVLPDELSGYADYISKKLDEHKIKDAFLVGHSMGGYCCLDFAKRYSYRVKGICLFHSSAAEDGPEKKQSRLNAMDLIRENKSAYIKTLLTSVFAIKNREKFKEQITTLCENAGTMKEEAIIAAQNAMMNREGSVEFLKERQFPLFYYVGQHDELLPQEKMLKEIQSIPGSLVHFSESAGHMGQYEDTLDAFGFLKRIVRAY